MILIFQALNSEKKNLKHKHKHVKVLTTTRCLEFGPWVFL